MAEGLVASMHQLSTWAVWRRRRERRQLGNHIIFTPELSRTGCDLARLGLD